MAPPLLKQSELQPVSEILTPQKGEEARIDCPAVVLDTNAVLALWMFRDPALDALRNWIEAGHCRLYSREDALEELRRVLAYRQFGLSTSDQVRILESYQKRARRLAVGNAAVADLPACQDADDQKFLELTVEANATYLITRDRALLKLRRHRHVRQRLAILTPERFLSEILAPVAHPAFQASSPEICRPPRR